MNKPRKEVKVYFFPWISGESFLFLLIFALVIIIVALSGISWVIDKSVGSWLHIVQNGYFTFFLLPIVFFISPQFLASEFGMKEASETYIQDFFIQAKDYKIDHGIYTYANLLFVLLVLICILLFYYKKGVKKGRTRWVSRFCFLALFTGIPIVNFISEKFEFIDGNINFTGHYTEIYKSFQNAAVRYYISFLICSVIIPFIGYKLILLVGRNKLERDRIREDKKLIGQEKRKKRADKLNEYY